MGRDRFPLMLLGGLLLVGAVVVFLTKGVARGTFADTLSTYRSEPDGARGLYLFLEASQVPVTRVQSSLDIIDSTKNLVLLAVEFQEGVYDATQYPSFLTAHGVDAGTPVPDDDKENEDDADKLHKGANLMHSREITADEREKLLEHIRDGATVVYVPWNERPNPMLKAMDIGLWRAERGLGDRTLVPALPTPFTLGVERVETKVRSWVDLPAGATPLLIDEKLGQTVAGLVPYGQGQLIVLGAPELAMNSALSKADNAQFWRSMTRALSRKRSIAFDEYHHGFTSERSMAEFAARYGLHIAVMQLLLGVAFWALALKRFGRARRLTETSRVGATDALFATSRLYREGRHHAHAAQAIVQVLAHEFAAKAGVSTRAKPLEIVEALNTRGLNAKASLLAELIKRAEAAHNENQVHELARMATLARQSLQKKKPAPLPAAELKKA